MLENLLGGILRPKGGGVDGEDAGSPDILSILIILFLLYVGYKYLVAKKEEAPLPPLDPPYSGPPYATGP